MLDRDLHLELTCFYKMQQKGDNSFRLFFLELNWYKVQGRMLTYTIHFVPYTY
jgi:hypothetical protein